MQKLLLIIITIIIGLLITSCHSQKQSIKWNQKAEQIHLLNQQNSNTWSTELLNRDIESNKEREAKPIRYGAFPVPKYELLGKDSFKGLGNGGNFLGIDYDDKKIVYAYFLANKNRINQNYVGDKPNEVFFTIVTLSDFIDKEKFSHAGLQIISRNNPDYIGQGFFKTQHDEIDYVAFITAKREEFAIINMRLFNLKNGRIILIAPQKDGSIQSMQIKSEILSDKDIDGYIKQLLQKSNVKNFFINEKTLDSK